MTKFIHDDFLLSCAPARELYHGVAESLPIIDYHCHLPPAEIAQDKRWRDIAEVWLGADHYKWRVMRTDGVDERFVTGNAPAREKFQKFAEAMPHALRNPMYHWCHLELARYFGIDDLLLSGDTADEVWERANAVVAQPWFSARGLISRSNVEALCTTDDPVDSLEHHAAVAADASFRTKVLPAWRPDKGFAIGGGAVWNAWVDKLAAAAGQDAAPPGKHPVHIQFIHPEAFPAARFCAFPERQKVPERKIVIKAFFCITDQKESDAVLLFEQSHELHLMGVGLPLNG